MKYFQTHPTYLTTTRHEGYVASNQTGKFPHRSIRGMEYVCIFYLHDPNFIKAVPIKNRSKGELLRVYKSVYKWNTQRNYKPRLRKLDNETSRDIEAFIAEQQATHQYTPP